MYELECHPNTFSFLQLFGSEEKGGIPWIKWKDICKPKIEGALGIKDIASFNVAVMCKWLWRCFAEENSIWYKLVQQRYGPVIRRLVFDEGCWKSAKESL